MAATTTGLGSGPFTDMISSIDRRCEFVENQAGANVRVNNFLTPTTLDNKSSILNAPCGYSNGVYASLRPVQSFGSELITNGDFATDSNWTKGTGTTISGGNANFVNATDVSLYQNIGTQSGTVKVEFTVTNYTSGTLNVYSGGNQSVGVVNVSANALGLYTANVIRTGGNVNIIFGSNNNFTGSIDNVSVKEVIDADFDFTRGSAATRVTKDGLIKNVQILSDELVQNGDFSQIGSELVTNGDFDTDSDWDLTDGATITDNGVRIVSDGTYQRATQYSILTVGKQYKIQYEIVENNSGNLKMSSSFGLNPIPTTVGTHTVYGEALQTFLTIERSGACDITITNISVKEVGQNWSSYDGNVIFKQGSVQIDTNGTAYTEFRAGNDFNSPDAILTIGNKYRLTYTISESNSGEIKTNSLIANDTILTSTVGTHTIEGLATLTSLGILRNGDTDITITNISVIEITDDTNLPRIDYTDGTGSLLLEPQSTNLVTYSEDYTGSSWTKSGVTLDSNNIISPDGTQNASKLTISGGTPYLGNGVILTVGNTYTVSCFVKKGTNRWVRLTNVSSGTTGAWFDLENNVVGSRSASSLSSSIKSYGNDWYKIQNTFIAQSGTNTFLGLSDSDNQTPSTQIGNTVYVWGFQIEELSYATSYIPTSGSTVTRNADVCNNAGSSDLINSTEGVLYAEISSFKNGGIGDRTISLSDGSTQNAIQLLLHNTANRINFRSRSGGSLDVNISDFTFQQNQTNKIACKFKSGDYALWVNGEERVTSSSSSLPTGLSVLAFDDG